MSTQLPMIDTITICGIRFTPIALGDLHRYIACLIQGKQRAQVLNINVRAVNLAQTDTGFREIINSAPLVFCDGFGVRLGARLLGHRVPSRITYADWMWQLADFAAKRGFTLFLLGARPGVAEKAAGRLRTRFPEIKIIGVHHGFFDKNRDSLENMCVIQEINACRPNILIVSFGMPLQEHWLSENWDRLETNVALTGGAAFDYISGELGRAPRWMTDHGLEWLGRLIIEPRRLWRRYLIGNPIFLWRVLKQRLGITS